MRTWSAWPEGCNCNLKSIVRTQSTIALCGGDSGWLAGGYELMMPAGDLGAALRGALGWALTGQDLHFLTRSEGIGRESRLRFSEVL